MIETDKDIHPVDVLTTAIADTMDEAPMRLCYLAAEECYGQLEAAGFEIKKIKVELSDG